MQKIDDQKLDQLLFETMSGQEEIPAGLSEELKRQLRRQQDAAPSINLWFAILFANAAMTLFSEILVIFFVSILLVQILAICHILLSLTALGVFVFLGHKYPALKEGALFRL